jgi:hypothetical protein
MGPGKGAIIEALLFFLLFRLLPAQRGRLGTCNCNEYIDFMLACEPLCLSTQTVIFLRLKLKRGLNAPLPAHVGSGAPAFEHLNRDLEIARIYLIHLIKCSPMVKTRVNLGKKRGEAMTGHCLTNYQHYVESVEQKNAGISKSN